MAADRETLELHRSQAPAKWFCGIGRFYALPAVHAYDDRLWTLEQRYLHREATLGALTRDRNESAEATEAMDGQLRSGYGNYASGALLSKEIVT